MMRFGFALLLLFIASTAARAQSDWDYLSKTPERLIGLLDLPDIIADGCGSAPKRETARAFDAPSPNARSIGTIYWREEVDACGLVIDRIRGIKEQIPTLESGYEIPAAIVFERRGSWFRIRLSKGSAWIHHVNAKDFLPYPEMLGEKLTHTMQAWDGTLRTTPGPAGRVTPLPPGWKALLDRQLSIQYVGSRRVGNDVWLHIRLVAKASCDQTYEGVTDTEGWIPAYQSDRTTLVWFSSRGC
jgi:hypothetical protein